MPGERSVSFFELELAVSSDLFCTERLSICNYRRPLSIAFKPKSGGIMGKVNELSELTVRKQKQLRREKENLKKVSDRSKKIRDFSEKVTF